MTETTQTGPIIFGHEAAREQLLERNVVYTFRSDERTTGETWARASRTGEKIADVTIEEVRRLKTSDAALLEKRWATKSGFGTPKKWAEAIAEINGDPTSGVVYRCKIRDR